VKINMSAVQLFSFSITLGLASARRRRRLFLFGIKKKQKMPAENFSFEGSCAARIVQPEKFVRPDLSRTGI